MQEHGLDPTDILELLQPNTFGKMLRNLKRKVRLARKRMSALQQAQAQQDAQQQKEQQDKALLIEQVIAENRENNANYRELIKLIGKNPNALKLAESIDPKDIPLVNTQT
jgi:Sec-independent protein translocase protein TatA